MKLLHIHIDNFGKLSNFDMDFLSNPVIIYEDNGWGKSTLATFIRVMFYGFEGENKKKLSDKERVRFRPWNKEQYGGSVIFEADGRQYEITRHFGIKDKEDSAVLIDRATMLETHDYDCDRLGIELFDLDEESFVRTVFLGQDNIAVRNDKDELEDGISAKIGNLTDVKDDIINYDAMMKTFKEKINALKSGRKYGIINEDTEVLTNITNRLRGAEAYEKTAEELEGKLNEQLLIEEQCKKKQKALDEEKNIAGQIGRYREWEKNHNAALEELQRQKEALDRCKSKLPMRIPTSEELDEYAENIRSMDMLNASAREYEEHEGRKELPTYALDEARIEAQLENVKKVNEYVCALDKLSAEMSNKSIRVEETNRMNRLAYEDKVRSAKEQYEDRVNEAVSIAKRKASYMWCIPALLFVTAFIMLVMELRTAAIVAAVLAAVCVAVVLYAGNAMTKAAKDKVEGPQTVQEPDIRDGESVIRELQIRERELQNELTQCEGRLISFFEELGLSYDRTKSTVELGALKEQSRNMADLMSKRDAYRNNKVRYDELAGKTEQWIASLGYTGESDYHKAWSEIKEITIRYQHIVEDYNAIAVKVKQSEESKDFDMPKDVETIREYGTIEGDYVANEEELEQTRKNISQYRQELDETNERLDKIAEDRIELEEVSERIRENEKKRDIIQKTSDYMENAKRLLSAKYTEPIKNAFQKYYGYISKGDADDYVLDANINITKMEMGERREKESLSRGYRDLVDIALRMALVDAMYNNEKPFVVMDDPFVNLDTGKLEEAKEFLNKMSADYQVIYFTCHESRA